VSITVTITQAGTAAVAAFVNKNTNRSYKTLAFYSSDPDSNAEGVNAESVIERAPGTTLANFGEVVFTDCSAADFGGYQYFLMGGTALKFVDSGTTLATGTIVGNSEVGIRYTGS
jgi:formylmethanofuran dehydrogenase subunit C